MQFYIIHIETNEIIVIYKSTTRANKTKRPLK